MVSSLENSARVQAVLQRVKRRRVERCASASTATTNSEAPSQSCSGRVTSDSFRKTDEHGAPSAGLPSANLSVSLDRLAKTIAPSVHGLLHVKKGLLLMLLGGVAKTTRADSCTRGNIHVCLLGDHATAKSTLLRWIASTWPNAFCASGASSSIAGLTVAVVEDDGEKTIKPGALLSASGSICCIDDFEQLGAGGQDAVCGVMDHQTITVTKAGIHTTLKSNTSVLAACSPTDCRYSARRSFRPSSDMTDKVKQCFDLVYVVQDVPDADADEEKALHIIGLARGTAAQTPAVTLPDLLRYITFAQSIQPAISNEASERLRSYYGRLRERGLATPRHLDNLIRVAEAVTRGHLVEKMLAVHVDEAFDVMEAASGSFSRSSTSCG